MSRRTMTRRATRRTRFRVATSLTLVPVFLMSACMSSGTGGSGSGDGGGNGGDPVSLRMMIWSSNEQHLELLNSIADDFTDDHPDVDEITFESRDPAEYNTALTTQLTGGNPPDMAWIFEHSADQFIASNTLVDIGPELAADEDYNLDDISDAALELWRDRDSIYAYPFSTSPFGIFYNADAFAEAGSPDPEELIADGDWTWDRLNEVGAEVVDAGVTRAGFNLREFDFATWSQLAVIWSSFGAEPWSEDGTECHFSDPEMVEALTYFHDMVFEDGAHIGPGSSADFFAGEAAMSATQISRAALLEDADFEWGLVPLPSGPAGEVPVIGQGAVGVLAASQNQDQATEFLTFMTNEENSARLAQFFPPARSSQLNAETLAESNPMLTEEQLENVVIDGIENGVTKPSHVNMAELEDTIRAELDTLWSADADVPTVLEQVCGATQPLLTEE